MSAPLLPTIVVKFSCHKCGLAHQQVLVRARKPDEDIVAYLEAVVTPALQSTHHSLKPGCQPTRLSDVMIPMGEDGRPGSPAPSPTVH